MMGQKSYSICLLAMLLVLLRICPAQGKMSDSAKALAERVRVGDYQSVLDAGGTGDTSLIPYLKVLASQGKSPWPQMALAKLGEKDYVDEIFAEVDNADPMVQDRAIEKLVYLGDKTSLRRLYQLLDDATPREDPSCPKDPVAFAEYIKKHPQEQNGNLRCDVIFFSRRSTVMHVLDGALKNYPDVPPPYLENDPRPEKWQEKRASLWKEWFENHKYLIE